MTTATLYIAQRPLSTPKASRYSHLKKNPGKCWPGKSSKMAKNGPSPMDACLGKRSAFIFICVYVRLFCGHSLHRFGTRALCQIAGFMPTLRQPNVCSCVSLAHTQISISIPEIPKCGQTRGCRVRDSGKSYTPSDGEPLSLTLKGVGTVLVPVSSLFSFILWTMGNQGDGRKTVIFFPIFFLSKDE